MLVLASVPVVAIIGVVGLVVVVGGLIYGAISQYRRSQLVIAEKRALQAELAAREEADRRAGVLREAAFSRIAFENQRRSVREDRPGLAREALALQGPHPARSAETLLLMPDAWMLEAPLPLGAGARGVTISAEPSPGPRTRPALAAALEAARPGTAAGPKYDHIADAIVELEEPAPTTYVNRDCYRVTGLELAGGGLSLAVARTSYFAALDEAVPLECEIAEAARALRAGARADEVPLPIRAVLHDPFDLGARTTVASVDTLVLRRDADGGAEFWLHRRRTTGMVGGQTHVVPAGVFQPAIDDLPDVFARDADLWHTMLRETAEELLGVRDVDSLALGADVYSAEAPMADLEAGRRASTVRPWLVGLGLDPLSLWLELLTVLVIDAATFDQVIGDPPRENAEGSVLGENRADGAFGGFAFTQAGVDAALAIPDLAPAADGVLRLAWKHRALLL